MEPAQDSGPGGARRLRWAVVGAGLPLLCVSAMLAIHPYRFGVVDHAVAIPFLKSWIDPSLYPGDYLIPQREAYYTYLWKVLALLVPRLPLPLPALFALLYALGLYASLVAIHAISLRLFARLDAALLAAVLALFSQLSLASIPTFDALLVARFAALPFLLFALERYLAERYEMAFALLGFAFLIHPLSAGYLGIALGVVSLARLRRIGVGRLARCAALAVAFAVPTLLWVLARGGLGSGAAEPDWLHAVRLRSYFHAFPRWWGWQPFAQAAGVGIAFAIAWRRRPSRDLHAVFVGCTAAILVVCLLGLVFSDWIPVGAVIQAQPLRAFKFVVLFATIYTAHLVIAETDAAGELGAKALAALGAVSLLWGASHWKWGVALVACFAVARIAYRLLRKRPTPPWLSTLGLLVLLLGAATGIALDRTPSDPARSSWQELQRWARAETRSGDWFVVPPQWIGFRVESERSVYADWKDGTLGFFDARFAAEWLRRMHVLGLRGDLEILPFRKVGDAFRTLEEEDYQRIADETRGAREGLYVVRIAASPPLSFPLVYENRDFVTYRVPEGTVR